MRQLMSGDAARAAGAGSARARAVARPAIEMSEVDFMVSPHVGDRRPVSTGAMNAAGKRPGAFSEGCGRCRHGDGGSRPRARAMRAPDSARRLALAFGGRLELADQPRELIV